MVIKQTATVTASRTGTIESNLDEAAAKALAPTASNETEHGEPAR